MAESKPLFVVISGPPAGGKGTQCQKISEAFGIVHLSTGDLLREAVARKTDLGTKAHEFMTKGLLVPDELVNSILKERLSSDDVVEKGVLLDGYPRTETQAKELEKGGFSVDLCLLLEVPDEVVIERAIGRRLDPTTGAIYHMTFKPPPKELLLSDRLVHRSDDHKEKMEERLVTFKRHIVHLENFYSDVLHRIDGNRKHDQVWEDVKEILSRVEAKVSS